MADDHILEYIKRRNDFIAKDYKLKYWIEILFFSNQKFTYDDRIKNFENKICKGYDALKMKKFLNTSPFKNAKKEGFKIYHLANYNGFMSASHIELAIEHINSPNKSENFLRAFEEMIQDRNLLPSKSAIILSQKNHHKCISKCQKLFRTNLNMKKSKLKADGCKKITDFFVKTKSPNGTGEKQKEPTFKYAIEEIIYKYRKDDEIEILWLPENHSELDVSEIISIHFCSEVALLMDNNENISELDAINKAIEIMPNRIWIETFDVVKRHEDFFMDRNQMTREDDQEDNE